MKKVRDEKTESGIEIHVVYAEISQIAYVCFSLVMAFMIRTWQIQLGLDTSFLRKVEYDGKRDKSTASLLLSFELTCW